MRRDGVLWRRFLTALRAKGLLLSGASTSWRAEPIVLSWRRTIRRTIPCMMPGWRLFAATRDALDGAIARALLLSHAI